jgi:excinuclease ABC subunit C
VNNSELKKKILDLPKRPGVYLFKNDKGKILYVGKANRLRDRVRSYFAVNMLEGSKTAALVRQIANLDTIEVASELEAIILEAELIKLHKPKYNIQLKDDKSSLYIVIRNEEVDLNSKKVKLPRVLLSRETELLDSDYAYGPYPNATIAKYVVRSIRKMFPYRDCAKTKFHRYHKLDKPCFYGHLGLCSAPCTSDITITDYKKDIKKIRDLLTGKRPSVISSIERDMKKLSREQRYEEAAKKRDLIERMEYVSKRFKGPQEYIDNPYLIEDILTQALDELVLNIPVLKDTPHRIECYDISNTSGKQATGSMVVAEEGHLATKAYRRFKIKFKDTPDDYEMMREVLARRFYREVNKKESTWGVPNLIVIDGGKGQVSAAYDVIDAYNLDIPVIGLAKKEELVIYRDKEEYKELRLSKGSEGLKLLQRLRDEAHRFAKTYHMKLRRKKLTKA